MRTASRLEKAWPLVLAVSLLIALSLSLLPAGCSGTASGETSSTSTAAASVTTGSSSSSTTLPSQLSERERDLALTARTQNDLARVLREQNAAADDPRMAIVYGLRARAQAIGCLQMLDKSDASSLDTADGVMLDIYHMLNLARDAATGTAAGTVTAARAVADRIGAPSDHVDEAKDLLQQFLDATAPLLDEAAAALASTTTT